LNKLFVGVNGTAPTDCSRPGGRGRRIRSPRPIRADPICRAAELTCCSYVV